MAKIKTKTIKKKNGSERDRFTVVLEAIQSDFQVFGEKLDFIDDRLDKIDVRFDGMDTRLDKVGIRLDEIGSFLADIKLEIVDLKTRLNNKADIDRLHNLEERVRRLEVAVAQKRA